MRFCSDGHECVETAAPGCTEALSAARPAKGRVAPDKRPVPAESVNFRGFPFDGGSDVGFRARVAFYGFVDTKNSGAGPMQIDFRRKLLVIELPGQVDRIPLPGIKNSLFADTRWAITGGSSRRTIGSTDPAPERRLDGANRWWHTTQLGGSGMKTAHRRTVDCGDAGANGDRP